MQKEKNAPLEETIPEKISIFASEIKHRSVQKETYTATS
jgi:hypothetical protein